MAVCAYVNFPGNCREAVEFYASIFKVKPYFMTFGEMPPDPDFAVPEEAKNLVMHASIQLFDSRLMFSDVMPGFPFVEGNNVNLIVTHDDPEEIKRVFALLLEGGKANMPLESTFWAQLYGSLIDKYGIVWQFNYEIEKN